MINNFWVDYLIDHAKSAPHKKKSEKKACFLANMQIDQGVPPTRIIKQSVLPFDTTTPSTKQISDRITGGMCPTLASGDSVATEVVESNIQCVAVSIRNKDSVPIFCEGVLVKKDLTDVSVQEGIKYTLLIPNQDFKYNQVCGLASVRSIYVVNMQITQTSHLCHQIWLNLIMLNLNN